MARAAEFPDVRGWIRTGDRYCPPCSWLIHREAFEEDVALTASWCPTHGEMRAAVTAPPQRPEGPED